MKPSVSKKPPNNDDPIDQSPARFGGEPHTVQTIAAEASAEGRAKDARTRLLDIQLVRDAARAADRHAQRRLLASSFG
jgi:hypothetical protein